MLLWVDLEMTGLNPDTQRIIEVAALVTDFDFKELGRYQAVINQTEQVLQNAEEWPRKNMTQLFDEVRQSQISEEEATSSLASFIDKFGEKNMVLAGNSIHQDRRFIRRWWPNIESRLHYRMFDVSVFKVYLQGKKQVQYQKQESHRALDDICESIAECKWALSQL